MIKNIDSKGRTLIKSGKYLRIDKLPFVNGLAMNLAANLAKFEVFLGL